MPKFESKSSNYAISAQWLISFVCFFVAYGSRRAMAITGSTFMSVQLKAKAELILLSTITFFQLLITTAADNVSPLLVLFISYVCMSISHFLLTLKLSESFILVTNCLYGLGHAACLTLWLKNVNSILSKYKHSSLFIAIWSLNHYSAGFLCTRILQKINKVEDAFTMSFIALSICSFLIIVSFFLYNTTFGNRPFHYKSRNEYEMLPTHDTPRKKGCKDVSDNDGIFAVFVSLLKSADLISLSFTYFLVKFIRYTVAHWFINILETLFKDITRLELLEYHAVLEKGVFFGGILTVVCTYLDPTQKQYFKVLLFSLTACCVLMPFSFIGSTTYLTNSDISFQSLNSFVHKFCIFGFSQLMTVADAQLSTFGAQKMLTLAGFPRSRMAIASAIINGFGSLGTIAQAVLIPVLLKNGSCFQIINFLFGALLVGCSCLILLALVERNKNAETHSF